MSKSLQIESRKNRSFAIAADRLRLYSDSELLDMISAMEGGKSFPPFWHAPLPRNLCPLLTPTIHAELQRRLEVAELEA